jgi:hypothetical protein
VAFVAVTFALSANSTYACYCGMPDVREVVAQASAVFVGEVIDIAESRTSDEKAPNSERLYTIKFRVEKSFKGVSLQEKVAVFKGDSKTSCFAYPEIFLGEKYLVYAYASYKNDVSVNGPFSISACGNRTGILSPQLVRRSWYVDEKDGYGRPYATEDLKELEEITNPTYKFQLNLKSNAAPNNSFNRSGNRLFFIRQLEGSIQYFPPG